MALMILIIFYIIVEDNRAHHLLRGIDQGIKTDYFFLGG